MVALGSVKKAVKTAVATRPGWEILRRRRRAGCVVLLYHRIGTKRDPIPHLDVGEFAAQIAWLVRQCHVITPEQLRERAARDTGAGRPDVLVTFDDGNRDYYDLAYPVLRSHKIRAVNFLPTRYVDDPALVAWWDKLLLAIDASTRTQISVPWTRERARLDAAGRKRLLRAAKDRIKERPNDERDALVASLLDALGVDEEALALQRQRMTWDEVRAAREFTCFGGHTHTHAIVSQLNERELDAEVRMCRDRLTAEIGAAPEVFAYPNGRATDFSDAAKATLVRYGFRTAFSAIEGVNGGDTDWMEVRRIDPGQSIADLAWRMSQAWR